MTIQVHNLNNAPNAIVNKHSSLLKYWTAQAKQNIRYCANHMCFNDAKVGAILQKVPTAARAKGKAVIDENWYIVPLCQSCDANADQITEIVDYVEFVPALSN